MIRLILMPQIKIIYALSKKLWALTGFTCRANIKLICIRGGLNFSSQHDSFFLHYRYLLHCRLMFFGGRQNDTKNATKNRNQVNHNKGHSGGDRGRGRGHRGGGRGGGRGGRANSNQYNDRQHSQSPIPNADVGGIMSNAQRAERFGTTDKTALYSQVHHAFFLPSLPHRTKQLSLCCSPYTRARTHMHLSSPF